MKKLIAFVIAAVMVLSMIPVMAISTSAADIEGDWAVYRTPKGYDVEEGEAYNPAPGYEYTSEGFTTIAPDWSNYTPWFTVQTKEAQNLKEGFYMQIRVDEYAYGGEDGGADHWISFNISDRQMVAPGDIEFGNNWLCLTRGAGDGNASVQSFITSQTTEEAVGNFAHQGDVAATVPMDDEGREIYTFAITWDGSQYDIQVNGMSVLGLANITEKLNTWNDAGDYYVGVTFHCGVANSTAGCTILKAGTSAEDATTPVGSDSAQPEDNLLKFGDPIDPNTVPADEPALMWDATMTSFKKEPTGVDIQLVAQGDNSYHVTATGPAPYFIWGIKSELTHNQSDFPVFAMLLKNFWGSDGGIYYCAGDIMSARDDYKVSWTVYDEGCQMYGEDDEYTLVVVDLTDFLDETSSGRIHSVRPFFSVTDTTDPEIAEWDISFMGYFRSIEEAQNYTTTRLGLDANTEPETTEAPVEETTAAPVEDTQAVENATTAATGDAAVTTAAAGEDEGGCGSVIGMGAVAILAAAAAAVALKKKD